jgi:hypothetical protein
MPVTKQLLMALALRADAATASMRPSTPMLLPRDRKESLPPKRLLG